ncbi:PPE family protein [Candidatus Mycobacterium methanotrophicum]|uniref:PPE family protein n=1 Tax=Candidatus Mycobacterium methanotrophicum TaxID=2943498 RepID=A0ABY4QJF1_9MYCO|nr:PPE family protein [Candidatus Mycobacterium methanotrophicum]UQX09933.1 PPE family protein [Candidatus Mycobacterium methanotrophicum]
MLDHGALPPEVNSGRMYAGPGSGSLVAAASAWQAIASQLDSVARGYTAVILGLQGETWSGNASTLMADAAQPYVEWIATAAAKAEETAGQARAASAAFESAHAATVPPALVTANRDQYVALVTANVFGQYTTQIAAAEAEYAQMWAQDAAAMYTYAAASSAASTVTPFGEPPQTTTADAAPAQAAAVAHAAGSGASSSQSTLSQLLAALPQQLQSLATGGSSGATLPSGPSSSALINAFFDLNQFTFPAIAVAAFTRTFFSGGSYTLAANRAAAAQSKDLPKIGGGDIGAGATTAESVVPQGVRGPVLADVGRAAPMGRLSVPQSWTSTAPVAKEPQWLSEMDLAAVPVSADAPVAGATGAGPMVGMNSAAGPHGRSSVNNVLRVPSRGFKMPRPTLGG